jgi:hypothetical protein
MIIANVHGRSKETESDILKQDLDLSETLLSLILLLSVNEA